MELLRKYSWTSERDTLIRVTSKNSRFILHLHRILALPNIFNWTNISWWFLKVTYLCHVFKTSYFHIHLSWLSISIENMWGLAKKVSIFLSLNTKFFLDGKFSHLSALCFLVKNIPFYTCTLENSCFIFLHILQEEKQAFSLHVPFLKISKVGTRWPL